MTNLVIHFSSLKIGCIAGLIVMCAYILFLFIWALVYAIKKRREMVIKNWSCFFGFHTYRHVGYNRVGVTNKKGERVAEATLHLYSCQRCPKAKIKVKDYEKEKK